MSSQTAHSLDEKQRTEDIQINENIDFAAMLLSDNILRGLQKCGFKKPSPIQLKAIPLGRCGFDLIMKAKSGTGKTAVFAITALEMVNLKKNSVQVLILAPTREIAVQIKEVISSIGCELEGLSVEYFIGGTPLKDDEIKLKECHIAVGAPGRIRHLIDKQLLNVSNTRLFVLDEADKLMAENYQADVNWIYHHLTSRKQVIAASATYPESLDIFLTNYMTSPTHVSPDSKLPLLLGLRQFYSTVKHHLNVLQQMKFKTEVLVNILSNVSFNQCLVFSNYQTRAESLSNNLSQQGWPAIFISGQQDQTTRLKAIDSLKQFKCRILSSTDLTARGIDAANVDLVINYDVPHDAETYLHRMGRAGRYGSYGICITLAAEGKDVENIKKILNSLGQNSSIAKLPIDNLKDIWKCDVKSLEQLYGAEEANIPKNVTDLDVAMEKETLQEKEVTYYLPNVDHIQNNELLEKAIAQLTKLLSKPRSTIDNTEMESVKQIAVVLENIKHKNELIKNNLMNKYQNIENQIIINKILNKTLNMSEMEDESVTTSSNKKMKPNEQEAEVIPTEINSNYETEAKSYQENIVLKKNIALYNITKFLTEQSQIINEECVKDINNLLEIIRTQNELEKREVSSENIKDFLISNNILQEKEVPQNIVMSVCNSRQEKICECSEQLFTMSYDYLVSNRSTENWKKVICYKHKPLTEAQDECEDITEELDEDWEEVDEECVEMETEPEYDENAIEEEYDVSNHDFSTSDNPNHEDSTSQLFAYPDYTSKKFVSFIPHTENKKKSEKKKPRLEIQSFTEECCSHNMGGLNDKLKDFITRRNSYASYYDHYSNFLAENAPRFTDAVEFHTWFGKWKEEVKYVRDFVQQDIFVKDSSN